jgi:hypothetical protein
MKTPKIKLPTLSLQKTQAQRWGSPCVQNRPIGREKLGLLRFRKIYGDFELSAALQP